MRETGYGRSARPRCSPERGGRAHHRAISHVCATVAEKGEDAPGHLTGTRNTDRRELCCGHWTGVYLSGIVLTLSNHLQK